MRLRSTRAERLTIASWFGTSAVFDPHGERLACNLEAWHDYAGLRDTIWLDASGPVVEHDWAAGPDL